MATVVGRAEQNARNRLALLSAARSVFLRAGYHATTVDAIAREAGFTTGAIYSRFAGKADLFLALLEERIAERARRFSGITPDEEGPLLGAIEAARRWAEIMRTDLEWSLLVIEFRVHVARDEQLAARYAELHERALGSLAENIAGSLPAELASRTQSVLLLARAAMAASTGAALARAAEGDVFDDDLYEQIVIALSAHFLGLTEE